MSFNSFIFVAKLKLRFYIDTILQLLGFDYVLRQWRDARASVEKNEHKGPPLKLERAQDTRKIARNFIYHYVLSDNNLKPNPTKDNNNIDTGEYMVPFTCKNEFYR